MSELAQSLLSELPQEEVKNPDAGVHNDAVFEGAELGTTKKSGYQAIARFSIPRKGGSGNMNHREFINLPMQDSHPRVKQIALGWFHAFGVVPAGSKNIPIVSDRDSADKVVGAINSTAGTTVGITLTEDDSGFLRARPLRQRT